MANNPQSGRSNYVGSEPKTFGQALVQRAKTGLLDAISDTGFGRALRAVNLIAGAEPSNKSFTQGSWDSGSNTDWRVKLSLPPSHGYTDSPILAPLIETGGLVFPYTPNIYITHSASYNSLTPVHSNYPFPVYQNSQVDTFTVTGDFTVENSKEAEYWIAAVHFLRSVTKMAYGESSDQGAPPPVLRLNGYGDYVFNNVPVVVQSFNTTLAPDVDYIQADIGPNGSWAPTMSNIAVTLMPVYSRNAVNKFSLDAFVSGAYILDNDSGYI